MYARESWLEISAGSVSMLHRGAAHAPYWCICHATALKT